MKDKPAQTFVMIGIVVAVLLFMHLMPQLTLAGTELRTVDVLSDVVPQVIDIYDVEEEEEEAPVSSSALMAGQPAAEPEPAPVSTRPVPKGLTPIQDFSNGKAGGMSAFYKALKQSRSMDRPVRVAYFGDSFVESRRRRNLRG